ncbi:hypothetical protein RYX36_033061, partial [Vicia faba]
LIDRARRAIRGSTNDIEWLQHAQGMPLVEDGAERFQEILDNIKYGVHRLPNSVVYLLIPCKVFSVTMIHPLYFVSTKISFSKLSLACHI